MRMNYLILGLVTLLAVIGLFVSRDPRALGGALADVQGRRALG